MIGLPRGVEVFLYGEHCDMRRSFNTLSALVQLGHRLQVEPSNPHMAALDDQLSLCCMLGDDSDGHQPTASARRRPPVLQGLNAQP